MKGKAGPDAAPLDIQLGQLQLARAAANLKPWRRPRLPGQAEHQVQLRWAAGPQPRLQLAVARARVAPPQLLPSPTPPQARPLALDIQARTTNLELAPLSPYSGKYAGYGIERGKLSVDLAYKVAPDGTLQVRNPIVLNQLTFGAAVERPDATRLPVRLALALLTDRHGVVDLDLPASGSINDPQFSIWGIVWKILGNLLSKALPSPFALLSADGADEWSRIESVPGTTRLAEGAPSALQKIAQALQDRPALRLTLAGHADPVAKRAALGDTERARLLKRLHTDTPLPDRPRNLIGLLKELPAAAMRARLEAAVAVTPDSARTGPAAQPARARPAQRGRPGQTAPVPGRAQAGPPGGH